MINIDHEIEKIMNRDQIAKSIRIVEENRKLEDPKELFYFETTSISDPYLDETGRYEVNPETYYGKSYIDWVNSL